METILAHAQQLVYSLLSLMPSQYQRDNLEAMLGLFLEAQGRPLPQHSKTKSASALSRFLNIYSWSTRKLIRTTREYVLQQLLSHRPKGRRPMLQVLIDLTTLCLGIISNVITASWKSGLFYPPNNSRVAPLLGGDDGDGFLVGWFKTAKHRFGLHRFGQGTLLGVYRWLVLSLIAYLLTHWAYLSTATTDLPDWGQAAQLALQSILPQLLLFLFLLDLERIRPLALSYGIYIQFSRCKI
jgi:hypothetical protein